MFEELLFKTLMVFMDPIEFVITELLSNPYLNADGLIFRCSVMQSLRYTVCIGYSRYNGGYSWRFWFWWGMYHFYVFVKAKFFFETFPTNMALIFHCVWFVHLFSIIDCLFWCNFLKNGQHFMFRPCDIFDREQNLSTE